MEVWLVLSILAIIVITLYLNTLSTRIKNLENEIYTLKDIKSSAGIISDEVPVKSPKSKTIIKTVSDSKPLALSLSPTSDRKIIQKKKSIKSSRTSAEWEALIGGKWLNWIGAVALIIAVGFFLKYAFDKNWINETVRVLIGTGLGIGLLLTGNHFSKKKYNIFAQGIFGAGISILYLSVFASFNYYHLIDQITAFILMSLVTIISFIIALRYESQAISVLSWAGGFLTPFLLSTGEANEIGLFTYIVLLDIGILAIVLKKDSWWILEPLTLGSTFIVYSFWYSEFYTTDHFLTVVIFLNLIWAMFFTVDLYRILKSNLNFIEFRRTVSALNILLFYVTLYIVVDEIYPDHTSLMTTIIGAIYVTSYLFIKWKIPENKIVHIQYFLTAVILIIFATSLQFTDFLIVTFWAVEALILAWIGTRWKIVYIWNGALALLVLTIINLFLTENMLFYIDLSTYSPLLNLRNLALSITILICYLISYLSHRIDMRYIKQLRPALLYVGSLLLLLLISLEVSDYFRLLSVGVNEVNVEYYISLRFLILAAFWMIYAVIFIGTGLKKSSEPLLYSGITVGFLSIAEILVRSFFEYIPIQEFQPLINERALVLGILITGLLINIRWFQQKIESFSWMSTMIRISHISLLLLVFILISTEIRDTYEQQKAILKLNQTSSDLQIQLNNLSDLQQLTLSGAWLFYSIILMVIGLWKRSQTLRFSAIFIFGISVLKIFIYDLSFLDTLYRIISFFILGVILLVVSYLYNRYKQVIFYEVQNEVPKE